MAYERVKPTYLPKNTIHERGLGLFQKEQLKRTLGTKNTETQEGWEKLCNEVIHNLNMLHNACHLCHYV